MVKAKKKLTIPAVLLIDLIDANEVAHKLPTEGQIINAVLRRRRHYTPNKTKVVCIPTLKKFKKKIWKSLPTLTHVHLAGHGNKEGIGTLDGVRSWKQVAVSLKKAAPKLQLGQRRVLTLSCCNSVDGLKIMRKELAGHFTGCYYLADEEPDFFRSITAWTMFYSEKEIAKPHKKVVDRINKFFHEEKMISFKALN